MRAEKKTLNVAGGALLGLLILVGCSSEPSADAEPSSSSAPVAEQDMASSQYSESHELAACVNEKGWDVTVDERDGGIAFEGTEAQMDQYQQDMEACMSESEDEVAFEDFTTEQWDEYYQAETDRAACLRDEGVNVPEIPSQQAFIDSFQGDEPWTAYSFVGEVSEDDWYRLNEACPQ